MNTNKIERALRDLALEGFDVASLVCEYTTRTENYLRAEPTTEDMAWPLLPAISLDEHLRDVRAGVAPPFGVNVEVGRLYRTTQAQRAMLARWFNIKCTPDIKVVEVVLFPSTRFVKEMTIATVEHLESGRVWNSSRKVKIDAWGRFCSEVKTLEAENAARLKALRFTTRAERLLKRAKELKVPFKCSVGTLATRLQGACESKRLTDSVAVREELKDVLMELGEHALVNLVRAPTTHTSDEEYLALKKALGL